MCEQALNASFKNPAHRTLGAHLKEKTKMAKSEINFAEPPALGTVIHYGKDNITLTLGSVSTCVRRDMSDGHVLTWQASNGSEATSGCRAKAVTWGKVAQNV